MALDRLLIDLYSDGPSVSVGTSMGDEFPVLRKPFKLRWPLSEKVLDDLRWYLEDYLRAPFGVYEERGPQVHARLSDWGTAVFSAVFGDSAARECYAWACERRKPVEVLFRSASPKLLGLPWELMRDPDSLNFLALSSAGVSRSLPVANSEVLRVSAGRLRVLMVICRPAGRADVGYRMIARPLLKRLESVRGEVDLVVLRPPTLSALGEVLASASDAGRPFQLVHFDGHGALRSLRKASATGMPSSLERSDKEGLLAFETLRGGIDEVSASEVAKVLVAARVPVVVLNACQSGAVGKDLEAAVATRLISDGVASVVGMAYRVNAVAAAEFMTSFYQQLFAGEVVSAAVTAGRQRLFEHSGRPSPKGDMPLADWLVPVHYMQREICFPRATTHRARGLTLNEPPEKATSSPFATQEAGPALDPADVFVGRDDLFYELEAAARFQHVMILHGPAGSGKTELAKAFGRWWRDTGGVEQEEWVLWHSFEPDTTASGLDGVINEIGLAVHGNDFATLESDRRRAAVHELLANKRMLLIWDNFETIWSIADRTQVNRSLGEADRHSLKEFISGLGQSARSTLLITSRSDEYWLGDNVKRILVTGLAPEEAAEYAKELLAFSPGATLKQQARSFGELMKWLNGYPLSMRLVLPRLHTTEPAVILDELRGIASLPSNSDINMDGRTVSLDTSISYSVAHLDESTWRILPVICLMQGIVDIDVLILFSKVRGVQARFAAATDHDWKTALDNATRVGLLVQRGTGMYEIHPALPGYLAAQWHNENPENYDQIRAEATYALLAAYARRVYELFEQVRFGDSGHAYAIIDLQERALNGMLAYALDHEHWVLAQAIFEPLGTYWMTRGSRDKVERWARRIRLATQLPDSTSSESDSPVWRLWLVATDALGVCLRLRHDLDAADQVYRQLAGMFNVQSPNYQQRRYFAKIYRQLGNIAAERDRFDEADESYNRALALQKSLESERDTTQLYHCLGTLAQRRGRFDEAERWYSKSLEIDQKFNNQKGVAENYYQLGEIAHARRGFEEAINWYLRALRIFAELGDFVNTAACYHQLGILFHDCGKLDQAEDWHLRALTIWEKLGDKPQLALSYYRLGILAESRRQYDDANNWYHKSLTVFRGLGNRPGMGGCYNQLGGIANLKGQYSNAEAWWSKLLEIEEELGDERRISLTKQLLTMIAEKRRSSGLL